MKAVSAKITELTAKYGFELDPTVDTMSRIPEADQW